MIRVLNVSNPTLFYLSIIYLVLRTLTFFSSLSAMLNQILVHPCFVLRTAEVHWTGLETKVTPK